MTVTERVAAPAARNKVKRKRFSALSMRNRAATAGIVVGLLIILQVSAHFEWISDLILPAPTDVWLAFVDQWATPGFWEDVWSTLSATVIGFVLAAVVAFALAAMLVLVRGLEDVMMPLIIAFETMPKIAIAPIIILWLGFGQSGKITIVVTVTFFAILINTLQGLRVTNRDEYDLLQSLGSTRVQLFRYVRLPRSLPYVFAGLRVGAVFALIGAIVAEFVGSENGLGALILSARSQFNVPAAWALLVDLMVIGVTIYAIMWWLEKKLLFWSKDQSLPAG
jgi:NitT/TauT family transport system permease protein